MRRIKILKRVATAGEVKKLKALAVEAGVSPDEIKVIDTVGEPDADCDDEIILVLASSTLCADAGLEDELATAQRGGRRAICIWPEVADEAPEEPTSAMMKYAYSIICFDAERLRAVVADDDHICLETPTGDALPTPETERHVCADEKVEAK